MNTWSLIVQIFYLQHHLRRASLTADDAFAILKAESDADYITYSGFCEGLRQVQMYDPFIVLLCLDEQYLDGSCCGSVNLLLCGILQLKLISHRNGLSDDETKDLWLQADSDGNGFLDYKKFQVPLFHRSSCFLPVF